MQGWCKVRNHMRESRFAKGGQPFAWGFGGCAPDHPSLSPAAEGGKNNFATALGIHPGTSRRTHANLLHLRSILLKDFNNGRGKTCYLKPMKNSTPYIVLYECS